MSQPRTPVLGLVLAAALLLTGCGKGAPARSVASDSPSASGRAATTTASEPTPKGSTAPSVSAAPTDGAGDCSADAIPDGNWEGPITMNVRGTGGGSDFADSTGTGTLRVVVANGSVKRGIWDVHWRSVGRAETSQASAKIDVTGTIKGLVDGPATKPVLKGTWSLIGKATVSKPGAYEFPIDETGTDAERMTVRATNCDSVTGSFIPSFTSKDALATFSGKARWVGSRVG